MSKVEYETVKDLKDKLDAAKAQNILKSAKIADLEAKIARLEEDCQIAELKGQIHAYQFCVRHSRVC